jgi:galactonate dehydratase
MRITGLSTVVVGAEMRNWVFVKLQTDEGLVGWGEATVEWKTRAVVACVEDLASLVVGEDPRRVEHLFGMMVRQHFFRPGMVEGSAIFDDHWAGGWDEVIPDGVPSQPARGS